MSDKTRTLTKGEEDIMKILWMLGKGTVNDILEHCDEPKPKYTTVATFLKLLEDKGFAGHASTGKSNMYYPLIEQKEYAGSVAGNMLDSFFGGSLVQMLSFFSSEKKLSSKEKQDLLKLAQEIIDKE
ncbi:MAG: BlaI/MecI/CopY family transcriptional regulator [Bacteroidales bacterium]|nr:BlaI/MecI/CopY family transcriptional regulator [Bacteroidales bacterium]